MSDNKSYDIFSQAEYPEDRDSNTQQDYSNNNNRNAESEDPTQEAFNPETGEINWDCPCLNGMAHGTCGEEFKAAFSCFVYSTEEQKGIDCVDKFQAMQDCFRAHPEEYGPELVDDDDDEEFVNEEEKKSEIENSVSA